MRSRAERELLSTTAIRVLAFGAYAEQTGSPRFTLTLFHTRVVDALVKRGLLERVANEPLLFTLTDAGREAAKPHTHNSGGPGWCSECRAQRAAEPVNLMRRFL